MCGEKGRRKEGKKGSKTELEGKLGGRISQRTICIPLGELYVLVVDPTRLFVRNSSESFKKKKQSGNNYFPFPSLPG